MAAEILRFSAEKDLPSKRFAPEKDLPSDYEKDLRVGNYSDATAATYLPVARELDEFFSSRAWSIENLSRWASDLDTRGISASTRALMFSAAISFLQFCADRSVHDMPIDAIKRILRLRRKDAQHKTRWRGISSVADLSALEGALNRVSVSDAAAVSLMLHAGLRANEVADLKTADVVLEDDCVRIELIGKGGKERVVLVPRDKAKWILAQLSAGATRFLFARTYGIGDGEDGPGKRGSGEMAGEKRPRQFVNRAVNRVGQQAGISLYPHQLRHTYANRMLNRTADAVLVQALLGHSNLRTTQGYIDRSSAALRERMEKHGILPQKKPVD